MRVLIVGNSLAHSLTLSQGTTSSEYEAFSAFKVASKTFASTSAAKSSIVTPSSIPKTHRRSRTGSTTSNQASISLMFSGEKAVFKFIEMPGHPLTAAAAGLPADCECVFIGWSGPVLDENEQLLDLNTLTPERLNRIKQMYRQETNSVPVFLDESYSKGYHEFCKSSLWPILHYHVWDDPGRCIKLESQWPDYVKANEAYAQAILDVFQAGDLIWIMDYQLMLLPGLLRRKLQKTPIGFYLRNTFPSSELVRCLPQAKELISGMLGANVIGFQVYAFARHFTSCCTRLLGVEASLQQIDYEGAPVELVVASTGIDPEFLKSWLEAEETKQKVARFQEMYDGLTVIVGIDRVHQVRSLKHKLAAFEIFLDSNPEWLGRVVLLQILLPESQEFGPNADLSEFLDEIARVNSQFGSLEYTPFQLFQQNIDLAEYYALLKIADCYISTKERDSLSMVALDFVLCQQEKKSPVVLSEFTALANSLSSALRINPWNRKETAEAIKAALCMSVIEKQARHQILCDYVMSCTRKQWSESFFAALLKCRETIEKYSPTKYLNVAEMKASYQASKDRYFFLDYDGTLTPIVKTPSAARPSEAVIESLRSLVADKRNKVFVVSGRDQETLEAWLGSIDGLGMSAEHGCFLKLPGSQEWIDLIADHNEDWKAAVLQVFAYFTERTAGSFIEQKRASITWHYRQCDPEFGTWQARQCQSLLESTIAGKMPVDILAGKKNLEVRPVSVNKGQTLLKILSEGKQSIQADFVFCCGDDRTDEDMFDSLMQVTESKGDGIEVITCAIGPAERKTLAKFHLNNPEQLIQTLQQLTEKQ